MELDVRPFVETGTSADPESATVDYLHDESKLSSPSALALYRPTSITQLQGTLAELVHNGTTITVSGARTGVTGGAVPCSTSVVLSTERLKSIGPREGDGIWVEAGVTLSELNDFLDREAPDLFFPVDPTETSASFGGMVSTNAGGARSFRFGSVRNWIDALQVELSDCATLFLERGATCATNIAMNTGASTRTLTLAGIPKPLTKHSIGYQFDSKNDPIDLFFGAEGTLGVVSRLRVRLQTKPAFRLFLVQFLKRTESAFHIVDSLRAAALPELFALEYLDRRSIEQACRRVPTNRLAQQANEAECALICEFGSPSEDDGANLSEQFVELVEAAGEESQRSFAGFEEKDLREIKQFRHAVPEGINALIAERKRQSPALHKIATDIAVPDNELRWVYSLYADALTRAGLDFAIFGHIGNNHFHVNILPRDEAELARAKDLYLSFAKEVVPRGGAVSAEHGIGTLKKAFLEIQYDGETLAEMRNIRRFFDPRGVFNPGVLIDE